MDDYKVSYIELIILQILLEKCKALLSRPLWYMKDDFRTMISQSF